MAQKSYKAKHRVLLKAVGRAGKAVYAEPGSFFLLDAEAGDKLVKLGAAVEQKAATEGEKKQQVETEADTKDAPKAAAKPKAAPKAEVKAESKAGSGEDLV